jgi:Transposase DDE domain
MDTWAYDEMEASTIWDARRRKSAAVVLSNIVKRPGASFSVAAGPAKRQAMHRLFEDKNVTVASLLAGHNSQTVSRIESECGGGLVLVVQDTVEYDYSNLKATTGLGYVNDGDARGIFGHSALALTREGVPLGTLHLEFLARRDADYGSRDHRHEKAIEDKESYRWVRTLLQAEAQMPVGQHSLFIQDREADIFPLLAAPTKSTTYLLVRANQSRWVEVLPAHTGDQAERGKLFDVACAAPVVGRMQVTIPRGRDRVKREAVLIVQCAAVRIMPPSGTNGVGMEPVCAWVVRACELHPPRGEEAVEWILVTTLPTPDGQAACQIVEYYTRRWRIERLHYTIKSGGCNAKQLHLDDAQSIMLALALYYIAAWRLLYIEYFARVQPNAPPNLMLRPLEIKVLEMVENKPITTCADALTAIAKLGGHEPYTNGPPPGIKALCAGYRRLEDMETILILQRHRLRRHRRRKI